MDNKKAKKYNLYIFKGDKVDSEITFRTEAGTPVDLTDKTLYFTAKIQPDSDLADTKSVIKADISEHFDALNGKTKLILTSEQTDVQVGCYFFDFSMDEQTIITGVLTVQPSITNRG